MALHRGAMGSLEYFSQHSPALAGRASQGVNFPALVLDYPFRDDYDPVIYKRNTDYTYISIYPKDVGFFVGIVLFWYWIGRALDKRLGRSSGPAWSRTTRIAGFIAGLLFGFLTAIYANQFLAMRWLPERQIAIFGLAWACALVAFFSLRIKREFSPTRTAIGEGFGVTALIFLVGLLWVGGPFGLVQACGEYLRPTSAIAIPLSAAHCSADEAPPANLMHLIDSQRTLHHLTFQKMTVCRSILRVPPSDPRFVALYGYPKRWLPVAAGGGAHQFRRHFAVVVADETGSVIVEAALIQSRWDYLRQNWNKFRSGWFWPYEGAE